MTSKHYRWQTRWRIEPNRAVHETGLVVAFDCTPGAMPRPRGQPINAPDIQAALEPKHGHNAATMIERMLREASELYGSDNPRHATLRNPLHRGKSASPPPWKLGE
jgi:hypothetical protein